MTPGTENRNEQPVWPGNTIQGQKRRLKFWEMERCFKCPVVGMCLTSLEQRQLLKKAGIPIKDKSPFGIHEILVASSDSDNVLSRRVDKLLNRKFGRKAALLLELDDETFKKRFQSAFKDGDCVGITWAGAVHPGLSAQTRKEMFGIIHMAMHWSGEQGIKLKQKLSGQRKEIDDLRGRIDETLLFRRALQKENEQLRQELTGIKTKLAAVEKEKIKLGNDLAGVESRRHIARIEQENQMLKKQTEEFMVTAGEKDRQMASLQEKNCRLFSEIAQQQEINRRVTSEAEQILREIIDANRCNPGCPSFDLCKKRVLIVGGIKRMACLYRELIESKGGIFEYHDGYMKNGVRDLESRLKRADIILCPVNCNSHAACTLVKQLGKKYQKPVQMLSGFGLNKIIKNIQATETN